MGDEYRQYFERIELAEKRATEVESGMSVVYDSAVEEWNVLFEGLRKLAESYHQSKTFQSSKMGELFRAWNSRSDMNAKAAKIPYDLPQTKWTEAFPTHNIPYCDVCGSPKAHHRLYGYRCDNPGCSE